MQLKDFSQGPGIGILDGRYVLKTGDTMTGSLLVGAHSAFGVGATVDPTFALTTTNSATSDVIYAAETFTTMNVTKLLAGVVGRTILNPSDVPSGNCVPVGILAKVETVSSNNAVFRSMYGLFSSATHNATGSIGNVIGTQNQANVVAGTGIVTTATGMMNSATVQSQTNNVIGIQTSTTTVGAFTTATARGDIVTILNSGATLTDVRAVHVADMTNVGGGVFTNTYGFYCGDVSVGTQTNMPFSFYASDPNAFNYFAGATGIGVTAPTSLLHLKAGTATASTAPLKFNSGTLLTTAEAGAVEFLTDAYYVTTTTGAVRRMVNAGNTGRATAQTAAVASVATYTLGATDASFMVSANANITTFIAGTFNVTVAYTDETNTARTLTLNFSSVTGTLGIALAAAGPFEGIPAHIRCKASTAITVATSGTFTSLTYNIESVITQIG